MGLTQHTAIFTKGGQEALRAVHSICIHTFNNSKMQHKGNKQIEGISRRVKLFEKCSTEGTRRIAMVKEACLVHVQTQKQFKKQLGQTQKHILCEKHTRRVQLSKSLHLKS